VASLLIAGRIVSRTSNPSGLLHGLNSVYRIAVYHIEQQSIIQQLSHWQVVVLSGRWQTRRQVRLMFDTFYVCVNTITAIETVGHRFKATSTNGHRFTALGLPWWSPIQVLADVDVA